MIFCGTLKENNDEFIELNVNVSELGYHSAQKGTSALCVSGKTVAPTITSISLCKLWLIVNLKSFYLWYEVCYLGDEYFGREVTGLDPVTSDLYVSY